MDAVVAFLNSLTPAERDFISHLDYGQDYARHHAELNRVIANGGRVDMDCQLWHPYEVVELGKNWLQPGHEREFVACALIVLRNVIEGNDRVNELDNGLEVVADSVSELPEELRELVEPLLAQVPS